MQRFTLNADISSLTWKLLALQLPGLYGDDIVLVRRLLKNVWQTYGRDFSHGQFLESGTMCYESSSVLEGKQEEKKTATFFCLPYFSIDEPRAASCQSRDEVSLHPIRTLLQYRYRSFSTPERGAQTWQPCKGKVLHVPQIWGLVLNSSELCDILQCHCGVS